MKQAPHGSGAVALVRPKGGTLAICPERLVDCAKTPRNSSPVEEARTRCSEVTVSRGVCAVVAPFDQHVIFYVVNPENQARKLADLIQGRSSTLQAANIDIICRRAISIGLQVAYGVKHDCIIIRGQGAQLVCVRIPSC